MKHYPLKAIVTACAISLASASASVLADMDKDKSSDLWARASLTTTYTLNSQLNPFEIDVDINKGIATLTGTVDNLIEKELAEELALGVDNVDKVNNQLTVKPRTTNKDMSKDNDKKMAERSFMQKVEDANLTARIKSQLLWNSNTDGLDINVNTHYGVVTLLGTVDSDAKSQLAEQIARNTTNVYDVKNQLKVNKNSKKVPLDVKVERKTEQATQTISDAWITTKVKSTLLYNRHVDGSDISIDTKDGVVSLQGRVSSDFERQEVISTAQSIKGVTSVKANLKEM